MKKILVNYADKTYNHAQQLNSKSGLGIGDFDEVRSFSPKAIDKEFYEENRELLQEFRGNGYWLWKPYFLLKVLNEVDEGDFVFYCDAGAVFVNSIDYLIECSLKLKQDMLTFEIPYVEKEWTKRDAFVLMDCDTETYTETLQRCSGFVLCRKSNESVAFVEEWLEYQKDRRIVSDDENIMGIENYTGFQENRHDQTVLSLLSKKYELVGLRDPSQLGNTMVDEYKNSPYPQIVESTRKRNISTRVIHKIKRSLGLDVYKQYDLQKLVKVWFVRK